MKATTTHLLKNIKVAKVTLNIGAGKNEDALKKGLVLLQKLAPYTPVKTVAKKRIPGWGLRPGLVIGCKVTVRKQAEHLLKRLLTAKENMLSASQFDANGNFSFGIAEYIDIEGLEYDPELKILGLGVAVTLERPGYRVAHRALKPGKIGAGQRVTKEEAIRFMQSWGVGVQ